MVNQTIINMPRFQITDPSGKTFEINAPDGATQEQALAYAQEQFKQPTAQTKAAPTTPEPSLLQKGISAIGGKIADYANTGFGAVRGAGSIGATAVAPYDVAKDAMAGQPLMTSNNQRREAMTQGLGMLGADTESGEFASGKLGAEIAGTAGFGDVIAPLAQTLKMDKLANALRSGGFNLGGNPAPKALSAEGVKNAATRVAGGAITGGAQAGAIDPETTGTGTVLGGALPVVGKVAGEAGSYINRSLDSTSKSLMQSALKPTLKQRQSGEADRAIRTLLDEGLNATKGGVEQLQSRVGSINDEVSNTIANSTSTIDKQAVIDALTDTRGKFSNQVSPTADLSAIDNVALDFQNHPMLTSGSIPVQQAQKLKQGTYKVLQGKYGETGSAATEAQKALARGLKEQIAVAHPEIAALNKRESDLINALGVTERRALLDENKNPVGLAALAGNPIVAAGMLADRSALVKSLLARGSNKMAKATNNSDLARLLIEQATPKLVGVSSQ
jgi:hypothetical protein